MPCLMLLTQLFLPSPSFVPFSLSALVSRDLSGYLHLLSSETLIQSICLSLCLPSFSVLPSPSASHHLPCLKTSFDQFNRNPGVGEGGKPLQMFAPLFGFCLCSLVSASLHVSLLKKSYLPTAVPFLLNSVQPILCLFLDSILFLFFLLIQSLMKHRLASRVLCSQGCP